MTEHVQKITARRMGYKVKHSPLARTYIIYGPEGMILATTCGERPPLNHWVIIEDMQKRGIDVVNCPTNKASTVLSRPIPPQK